MIATRIMSFFMTGLLLAASVEPLNLMGRYRSWVVAGMPHTHIE